MTASSLVRPWVRTLAGYVAGEQPRDRAYVKLNTNENPYPPSPRVVEAIRAATTGDLRLYPDPTAIELRKKASAVYGVSPESILAGTGSDELLSIVFRACVGPGDRVVFSAPTYTLYETLSALQGATADAVPFPDDYRLPVESLGERGQALTIVCNPNAPSGTLAPIAAIEDVARGVKGLLLVDEAYADFAGETALTLATRYENVLIVRTFSKSFSLAGMRVGLAFGHPALVAELAKVKDCYNVSRLGLVAAAAALDDHELMEAHASRIRAARATLSAGLPERGFRVYPSEANFILARRPGEDLAQLQQKLKDKGVLVRHFPVAGLRDALRITVGTPHEVAALFAALSSLSQG